LYSLYNIRTSSFYVQKAYPRTTEAEFFAQTGLNSYFLAISEFTGV
jgi:hypothetical protein